jgi:hypothetical protein
MRLTAIAHHLMPFAALAGGILVLLMPRLLNYVVAIYLILVGFLGLNSLITSSADKLAPRLEMDARDGGNRQPTHRSKIVSRCCSNARKHVSRARSIETAQSVSCPA